MDSDKKKAPTWRQRTWRHKLKVARVSISSVIGHRSLTMLFVTLVRWRTLLVFRIKFPRTIFLIPLDRRPATGSGARERETERDLVGTRLSPFVILIKKLSSVETGLHRPGKWEFIVPVKRSVMSSRMFGLELDVVVYWRWHTSSFHFLYTVITNRCTFIQIRTFAIMLE